MKLIKQGTAGLLLTLGIFLLTYAAYKAENNDLYRAKYLLLRGIPLTGAGGLLVWEMYQKDRKQRLHSVFYQLLNQNQGRITLMQFALEAQLTAGVAKQYLDEKAKDFGAAFNVSEDGQFYYCFHSILSGG
ncbi:MAG: hypothetical protein KME29_32385 [Calothrix sp. FI2-JRJ7]|jgi:large subunit ribosomal protein L7/L12|nr:hypothetical protein [Calothrix sp. FI2-JRJ7]